MDINTIMLTCSCGPRFIFAFADRKTPTQEEPHKHLLNGSKRFSEQLKTPLQPPWRRERYTRTPHLNMRSSNRLSMTTCHSMELACQATYQRKKLIQTLTVNLRLQAQLQNTCLRRLQPMKHYRLAGSAISTQHTTTLTIPTCRVAGLNGKRQLATRVFVCHCHRQNECALKIRKKFHV